jgi:hypothetical protein
MKMHEYEKSNKQNMYYVDCSWSQFVQIFYYLSIGQLGQIPPMVFGIMQGFESFIPTRSTGSVISLNSGSTVTKNVIKKKEERPKEVLDEEDDEDSITSVGDHFIKRTASAIVDPHSSNLQANKASSSNREMAQTAPANLEIFLKKQNSLPSLELKGVEDSPDNNSQTSILRGKLGQTLTEKYKYSLY